MEVVKVSGCGLSVISYVAPRQEAENAPDTGKALFFNTVLSKPVEETAEQNQRFPRVCMLPLVEGIAEPTQRNTLFQTRGMSCGQPCTLIIDSGMTNNLVAREMVEKLALKRLKHPTPYRMSYLQEGHELLVDEQCEVEFHIDKYMDKVICDIISMNVCDILLGRPWQYDRDVVHNGKENYYKVYKDGMKHKLVPIKDEDTAGRNTLFQTRGMSCRQPWTVIIDSGTTNNLVAREMVEKLALKRLKHPTPYRMSYLQEGHELLVDEQCEVEFHFDEYMDKVICDIISMNVCDILLGRPWHYDRDVVHYGKENYYKVYKDGMKHKLVPIKDEDTAGTSATRSQFLIQVESPKEKVTKIEPTTEKATEEEVPVSSPAEEVPAAEKTVDELPATVEISAEESTVTPPASEPEAESAPGESEQVEKPKEESGPAAKEAEPAKEETVKPAEAAPAEEGKAEE